MFIRIDQSLDEPLYQQIRNEIVRGIAQGELAPDDPLPSVRRLAGDLGINLHTVNKAYALLRDQGFVIMRGRSGAFIACHSSPSGKDDADEVLARELVRLAESYKASGGTRSAFEKCVSSQLDVVFGKKE